MTKALRGLGAESALLTYDDILGTTRFRTYEDPVYLSYGQLAFRRATMNLSECGELFDFTFSCKKCEEDGRGEKSVLKTVKIKKLCGLRYCNHIECVVDRFKKIIEQLKGIKRLDGLDNLMHFFIGFKKIDIEYFKEHRKDFERILHTYFSKLKKAGIVNGMVENKKTHKWEAAFQAFKVLDISKGANKGEWDGKYYIHYHFAAIPWKAGTYKKNMAAMQQIRRDMIKNMKKDIPFHLQFAKNKKTNEILKPKEKIFAYLALRSIGLYKPYECPFDDDFKPKSLRDQLKDHEFMQMSDLFTLDRYIELFYHRRFFSTVGGLPYGTKSSRIIVSNLWPKLCPVHGVLELSDVRLEVLPAMGVKDGPDGREMAAVGEFGVGCAVIHEDFDSGKLIVNSAWKHLFEGGAEVFVPLDRELNRETKAGFAAFLARGVNHE